MFPASCYRHAVALLASRTPFVNHPPLQRANEHRFGTPSAFARPVSTLFAEYHSLLPDCGPSHLFSCCSDSCATRSFRDLVWSWICCERKEGWQGTCEIQFVRHDLFRWPSTILKQMNEKQYHSCNHLTAQAHDQAYALDSISLNFFWSSRKSLK